MVVKIDQNETIKRFGVEGKMKRLYKKIKDLEEELDEALLECEELTEWNQTLTYELERNREDTDVLGKIDMFCLECSSRESLTCYLCPLYKLVVGS